MTNAAPATIAHPSDDAATVAKPAAPASAHHGLDAPAHATKPAKQAVSTTSAGRHAVGWAPANGPADGRGDGDHGDDDRVALGDPVAADSLASPANG